MVTGGPVLQFLEVFIDKHQSAIFYKFEIYFGFVPNVANLIPQRLIERLEFPLQQFKAFFVVFGDLAEIAV